MVLAKALKKKPISGLRKKNEQIKNIFAGTLPAHWTTEVVQYVEN